MRAEPDSGAALDHEDLVGGQDRGDPLATITTAALAITGASAARRQAAARSRAENESSKK